MSHLDPDRMPSKPIEPQVDELVTPRVLGDFNQNPIGARGDLARRPLKTIDDFGAQFIPERLHWGSSR